MFFPVGNLLRDKLIMFITPEIISTESCRTIILVSVMEQIVDFQAID